jgi:hypothetical protein
MSSVCPERHAQPQPVHDVKVKVLRDVGDVGDVGGEVDFFSFLPSAKSKFDRQPNCTSAIRI